MFSYDEVSKRQTAKERIAYCTQELPFIGAGSGRKVYSLSLVDNLVIKVAKNSKGVLQNTTEVALYAHRPMDVYAQVLYAGRDYAWIVSQKCATVDAKVFKQYAGAGFHAFCRCLNYARALESRESLSEEAAEEFQRVTGDHKNTYFDKFWSAVSQKGLQGSVVMETPRLIDTHRLSSWGLTMEETPRLVLVDYGSLVS